MYEIKNKMKREQNERDTKGERNKWRENKMERETKGEREKVSMRRYYRYRES